MIKVPECFQCKHYENGKCPAYPQGIPGKILAERKDGKVCGDGLQYEHCLKSK